MQLRRSAKASLDRLHLKKAGDNNILYLCRAVEVLSCFCGGQMPRDWRVGQKTARASKLHTLRDTVERCPRRKFLRVSGLNRSSLSSVKLRCSSGEQQL